MTVSSPSSKELGYLEECSGDEVSIAFLGQTIRFMSGHSTGLNVLHEVVLK
jgi:hypothetical protein